MHLAPLPSDPLLDVKAVQRWLGLSRSTIYRLLKRNELPSVVVGTARRFRPEELLAYLEARPGSRP